MATFADPKTDFVFKRILGAEARKPLLMALLNHLLEFEGDRRIVELQRLPAHQHVNVPELRLSIVDVKCTDSTGRHFIVGMQVLNVEGFEKPVVYNASKPYVMQLRDTDEYSAPCDVVGVTICNFNLWPEQDADGRFRVPMLSRWRMQEQRGGMQGLPRVQYTFLELPKYAGGDSPRTLVDKWAYLFREARSVDVLPLALLEWPFRDVLELARRSTFSAIECEAYERAKMAEQDMRGALAVAWAEGFEEGRREADLSGRRAGLLRFFARAGMALTREDHARIEACTDPAILDRWIENMIGAETAAEVLT